MNVLPQRSDTVFQLSLTELAFILIFIVLLLIGSKFMVMGKEQTACNAQKRACYEQFPKVIADPEGAITDLVNAPKLRAENAELKAKLERTEEELKVAKMDREQPPDPVAAARSTEFRRAFEEATGKKLTLAEAREAGTKAAFAGKELANCQGQLKHCVKGTSGKKGYGWPPCWTTEQGAVEYMFDVYVHNDGVRVVRAWPDHRLAEVAAMPAVEATVLAGQLPLVKFKELTLPILQASKRSDPECRHYVRLRRDPGIRDIDRFNAIRLGVEDHFGKWDGTGVPAR